jgi:hypothetical protein
MLKVVKPRALGGAWAMRTRRQRTLAALTVAIFSRAAAEVPISTATAKPSGKVHGGSCSRVSWRSERNGNQRCPVAHSLLSDTGWIRLHWTSWGDQQAFGYGEQVHENALCSGEPVVVGLRSIQSTST